MCVTLHTFFCWAVFFLSMWMQLAAGPGTMVHRFQLAARFDAKITQHNALASVTECIHEMIPDRNATKDDFMVCLTKLGVPQTIIP